MKTRILLAAVLAFVCAGASAQKYSGGVIDRTAAVVGGELITVSDIEAEVRMQKAQGLNSAYSARCDLLENMMEAKLFLMQARVDSLTVSQDMVEAELKNRLAQVRTALGGDAEAEAYFG